MFIFVPLCPLHIWSIRALQCIGDWSIGALDHWSIGALNSIGELLLSYVSIGHCCQHTLVLIIIFLVTSTALLCDNNNAGDHHDHRLYDHHRHRRHDHQESLPKVSMSSVLRTTDTSHQCIMANALQLLFDPVNVLVNHILYQWIWTLNNQFDTPNPILSF